VQWVWQYSDQPAKVENRQVELLSEVREVSTGVARIVELEEQGWTYLRP
jgi:intracellular sulfur oxidation DsrE/DsrF family protein